MARGAERVGLGLEDLPGRIVDDVAYLVPGLFILRIDLELRLNMLFDGYARPGRGQPCPRVGTALARRADKSVERNGHATNHRKINAGVDKLDQQFFELEIVLRWGRRHGRAYR